MYKLLFIIDVICVFLSNKDFEIEKKRKFGINRTNNEQAVVILCRKPQRVLSPFKDEVL
jgi:hypothetical protein